jgi:hypothetical protein
MTKLVAVTGVAPAVGTSTLARELRDRWTVDGLRVDLVEEDELLTRAEFAPAARELAVTGACAAATLASCVATFAERSAAADHDVVICDALLPFVRSLSDWDNGEIVIDGFLEACTSALASMPFTVVYLDADIYAALRHAMVREPPGWLDWYVSHLLRNTAVSTSSQLDLAVSVLDAEREMALRLMAKHGWDVRRIPEVDLLTVDEVLDRAHRRLEPSPA